MRATVTPLQDAAPVSLNINQIQEMIPHRYPMLLVDKLIDVYADDRATGIKNVTINDQFFNGHFPGQPVMPGVLIIEAMAQTAAVFVVHTSGESSKGKIVYFMTLNDVRFRKPVVPGDQLQLRIRKDQQRKNVWKFIGEAYVDDRLVAEAKFSAMILNT